MLAYGPPQKRALQSSKQQVSRLAGSHMARRVR